MANDNDPVLAAQIRIRQAADQFSAAITDVIRTSMRTSVARQIAAERGNEGPWILHADGRVDDYNAG